jgi:hypothetical protein
VKLPWKGGIMYFFRQRHEKRDRLMCGLAILAFFFSGCSVRRTVIRMMVPSLEEMSRSVETEGDTELVRAGLPGNILTLEGILASAPGNREIGVLVIRSRYSYAFAFLEDEDAGRAKAMYERGKNLGFEFLQHEGLHETLPLDEFELQLSLCEADMVPLLFWIGNCWASWINLSRDNPSAIIQLPRVEAIMHRIIELDETYYYGGAHLVLGVLNASRPPMLGGKPEAARAHFDRAFEISNRTFLLIHFFFARYYCLQVMDGPLFNETLGEVVSAPADLLPAQKLANTIAKEKARKLRAEYQDFF